MTVIMGGRFESGLSRQRSLGNSASHYVDLFFKSWQPGKTARREQQRTAVIWDSSLKGRAHELQEIGTPVCAPVRNDSMIEMRRFESGLSHQHSLDNRASNGLALKLTAGKDRRHGDMAKRKGTGI